VLEVPTLLRPQLALLALVFLMVLLASPSVHANVSIEYLGPYPLNPTPVPGHPGTLSDYYTVGNAGNEQMIMNMTVSSDDPDFNTHFTVAFSNNLFPLGPSVREGVTATFVFDSSTPVHDYSANIGIVASAVQPSVGSPGRAAFDLPVDINSNYIPPATTTTTSTTSTSTTSSTTGHCILLLACIGVSAGTLSGLTAVAVDSIPIPPPVAAGTFPYGLFSFAVSGLSPGQTVTVTITLSSPLPAGTFSYWKFQAGAWTQFPSASLDPTRMIVTLTFIVPAGSTSISDPGGPAVNSQVTTTTQTTTTTQATAHSSTTTLSSRTIYQSPLMYITVNTCPIALGNPQGGGTHPVGSVITISVDNVTGYTFTKWIRDGIDYTSQQSFNYTVDASRTFTAIFQATSSIGPTCVAQSTSTTYTANTEVKTQTAAQVATSSAQTSPQVAALSTNPSPHCMIATAAYGSEMAPEVAYMRYVRDNLIGSTPTGKTLRNAFNAFYYSWSPPVAAAIAQSSDLQALFRFLLLPIVAIVHTTAWIFTTLGGTDFASVVAFGVAAVLCVGTYIVLPVLTIRRAWKRIRLRTWLARSHLARPISS
jgi:hypothetical protein